MPRAMERCAERETLACMGGEGGNKAEEESEGRKASGEREARGGACGCTLVASLESSISLLLRAHHESDECLIADETRVGRIHQMNLHRGRERERERRGRRRKERTQNEGNTGGSGNE